MPFFSSPRARAFGVVRSARFFSDCKKMTILGLHPSNANRFDASNKTKKHKKTGDNVREGRELDIDNLSVVVVVPASSLDHLPLALPPQHALLPGSLRQLRELRLQGRRVRSRRIRLDTDSRSESSASESSSSASESSSSSSDERSDAAARDDPPAAPTSSSAPDRRRRQSCGSEVSRSLHRRPPTAAAAAAAENVRRALAFVS